MHPFFGCTGITETDDQCGQQHRGNLPTGCPSYEYHQLHNSLELWAYRARCQGKSDESKDSTTDYMNEFVIGQCHGLKTV
jgi:hypothetical protein